MEDSVANPDWWFPWLYAGTVILLIWVAQHRYSEGMYDGSFNPSLYHVQEAMYKWAGPERARLRIMQLGVPNYVEPHFNDYVEIPDDKQNTGPT